MPIKISDYIYLRLRRGQQDVDIGQRRGVSLSARRRLDPPSRRVGCKLIPIWTLMAADSPLQHVLRRSRLSRLQYMY